MDSVHGVIELVRSAVVTILSGPLGSGTPKGSGFFVAPKRVLTCAHVLHEAGADPHVLWDGTAVPATTLGMDPAGPDPNDGVWDAPDAAVVSSDVEGHPVAPLATSPPAVGHDLYVYGFTRVRLGTARSPELQGSLLKVDALAHGATEPFHKVSGSIIAHGMSGGPVLDLDTFGVCGLMQANLPTVSGDPSRDGWVVPVDAALGVVAEELRTANVQQDPHGMAALRAAQRGFGMLPCLAVTLLPEQAVKRLVLHLEQAGRSRPATVSDADLAEWVARQLFRLSLVEAAEAVLDAAPALGESAAELLGLLAACVPARAAALSWWIPGDAALTLRAELGEPAPRVVHVTTDKTQTLEGLLLRALEKRARLRTCGGPASATTTGDVPVTVEDDIKAKVLEEARATAEEWEAASADFVSFLRKRKVVLALDLGVAVDKQVLAGILARYKGVSFLLQGRKATLPANADDVLLALEPAIDEDNEKWGLRNLELFAKDLAERKGTG